MGQHVAGIHARNPLPHDFERQGIEMDMMIAAHAMSLGAILVTNNMRHHGRLAPGAGDRELGRRITLIGNRRPLYWCSVSRSGGVI